MKKFAKILGIVLGTLVGLIVLLVVGSRFSDGPLVEMLPGGPFTSGEIVTNAPTDWSFLADRMYVEFESNGRSRTRRQSLRGRQPWLPSLQNMARRCAQGTRSRPADRRQAIPPSSPKNRRPGDPSAAKGSWKRKVRGKPGPDVRHLVLSLRRAELIARISDALD